MDKHLEVLVKQKTDLVELTLIKQRHILELHKEIEVLNKKVSNEYAELMDMLDKIQNTDENIEERSYQLTQI